MVDLLANKLMLKAFSRRNFLAGAGAVTAATMVGCGNDTTFTPIQPVNPTPATALTDVDILNFALNLEYLEAEFYLRAATGNGIPTADQGTSPGAVTIKSGPVTFSNSFYQQIAFELAQTELQHVRAIRATITSLGGTPIDAPARNYTDTFNTIAVMAGLPSFDPFASDLNYFVGALAFEEVGVSAYTGAAVLIQSTNVLDAAAGIQAAESYHAGTIRTILAGQALVTGTTTYIDTYNGILGVENKSDTGGHTTNITTGGVNASGVVTPSTVVSADSNALAFARTPDEVMHIVYGTVPGVLTASGGFFPSGLNGTIKQPTT